ncbi:RNA processing factor 1 [Zalerion maritima]|uniref:RNA processing factor 1 n=1 Tax=Zalerion maritima TaxID=339359 RepID=A0AAD5RZG5_9PEZI|nr:RNA processing factor 1 [Zalerion maritima]
MGASSFRSNNRVNRKSLYVEKKKNDDKERRNLRFDRKRQERKDPTLRAERLAQNQTITIEKKREWDDVDDDSLGASVDVEQLRQRYLERDIEEAKRKALQIGMDKYRDNEDEDVDMEEEEEEDGNSILDSDSENNDEGEDGERNPRPRSRKQQSQSSETRDSSTSPSVTTSLTPSVALSTTSTNLDLTPSSLALKFPMLFSDDIRPEPKILVTTSLNGTIHNQAKVICSLFPNSVYIPRSAHRYGHKYSVREIAKFAHNRDYTSLVVVREDQKEPTALTIVHLPSGPTFTFTISNWVEGTKLPGHGNPTNHFPELLLNNFKTPLGLLTARLFLTLFPQKAEFQGRQVVTLHNQRDYIFVRRHRYVFREKRETEKNVQGSDGKDVRGVEGVRAGLQELGPRFTLKLRRVDKGIGRAGSEGDDATQWEWKAKMEKKRTRFNL